ncbi:hypothetical protein SAMN05428964_103420 [Thalassospira xiamenensis]|uniref:Uncharacterized protein n=2 Tax=Thalassospira xiamenensis TaxID=220697 RepID=A0A285THD5_9PROT|nr:hypothetical protein SAMN05428964_103420 [Thalassospira xiamenensis]
MVMKRWMCSPKSKMNWDELAPSAPYRASIGMSVVVPMHDVHLSAACKVSRRGHRLLMAFEFPETRDYFLECYRGQDAHAEPDGAEKASAKRNVEGHVPPVTLSARIGVVNSCIKVEKAALGEVKGSFNREIECLLANGQAHEALGIVQSMHPRCVLRLIAIQRVLESGLWDNKAHPLSEFDPTPFTQERAKRMLSWLRAYNKLRVASQDLDGLATPMAQEILALDGPEALMAFKDTLPQGITKALIGDMARVALKKSRRPSEDAGRDDEATSSGPGYR